ncbi:MAG: MMPL family transporter [Deltaproteobacteria bacterium]|jgi:uncharacterized protein|nr:MMPL family transporter [Deltaproteobacteria bacterium]MBT4527303.1 MMPL family transporter [Deltaproteobacteria bacterium]
MKQLLNALSHYFATVPDHLRRIKWFVWAVFIVVTIVMGFGIVQNKFDMTLESWFSDDDPTKLALNQFRGEFGSEDGIFIVYKAKDGDILSENSLKAVHGIREEILNYRDKLKPGEISALEHLTKINSIVSASVLEVDQDTLISKKFIGTDFPETKEQREILRDKARKQQSFPLFYFSKDFLYGAITVETDFGTIPLEEIDLDKSPEPASDFEMDSEEFEDDGEMEEISVRVDQTAVVKEIKYKAIEMQDYLDLMTALETVLYQKKYTDVLEFYPVGNAPMMKIFMEMMEEMGPLFGVMILIMVALLWYLFRSISAVLWPIAVVVLSCVWTLGLTGWLGATVTSMITLTVLLILAVGIADAIHIISGYLLFRKEGMDHQVALTNAFEKAALPCLLTTVTTMVGMLALSTSEISHIQVFGYMSAAGVFFAFIFTIYLLPLMLDVLAPVSKKGTYIKSKKIKWIPDFSVVVQKALDMILPIVKKSPGLIIAVFAVIFGLCIYGATQVKVDSNMVKATKEGSVLRIRYDVVDTHMAGTQNMEIYIDLKQENALKDPLVLKAMEKLQRDIEQKYQHLVARTFSLADVVKDTYKALNEDRDEMYIIPDNPRILSQSLFMFNNANPEDRRRLVSDNYSKSHISVQLYNAGSFEYNGFFNQVKADIDQAFVTVIQQYPSSEITITGGLALLMQLADYISWSQVRSLGMVIAIISILLIFIFGTFRIGIMSIVPNLIPATLTFGLLGLFDIPLDSDTIIIAPVIIGIAVDDTIHFITHYRGEILKTPSIYKALVNTVKEVGQAITFTTLILGFGFFIMAFSTNTSLVKVGIFGSLAIFVALLCDLFLIPALILIFKMRFANQQETGVIVTTH